jgi:hypothetical protein
MKTSFHPCIAAAATNVLSVCNWQSGHSRNCRLQTSSTLSRRSVPARLGMLLALLVSVALVHAQNLAGDEALSKVLIDGQDWQEIGSGYGFTDAACSDAEGNFYFSDLRKNTLYKVALDGKVSPFFENGPSISGLKFGSDGRLYACTQGAEETRSSRLRCRRRKSPCSRTMCSRMTLIVSKQGFVYFTVTGKGESLASMSRAQKFHGRLPN